MNGAQTISEDRGFLEDKKSSSSNDENFRSGIFRMFYCATRRTRKSRIMENEKQNRRNEITCILLACDHDPEAGEIMREVEKLQNAFAITRVSDKQFYFRLLEEVHPRVVIANYDFGIFPFLSEVREKTADIPFIVISELELSQNALKHGINIYILRSELTRLGVWLNILADWDFKAAPEDPDVAAAISAQIFEAAKPLSAPKPRVLPDLENAADSRKTPQQPVLSGPKREEEKRMALKKWTEEIELQKLNSSPALPRKKSLREDLLTTRSEEDAHSG
jgi:hypothetical protein